MYLFAVISLQALTGMCLNLILCCELCVFEIEKLRSDVRFRRSFHTELRFSDVNVRSYIFRAWLSERCFQSLFQICASGASLFRASFSELCCQSFIFRSSLSELCFRSFGFRAKLSGLCMFRAAEAGLWKSGRDNRLEAIDPRRVPLYAHSRVE